MDFSNFATVGSIALICFFAGLCWKKCPLDDKWIPCVVGGLGAILGVVGMYVIPDYPSNNIMDAIAVGIFSGLSATGVHQIYKQLSSKEANVPADVNYTWDEYQADKGKITFPANEDETTNGQS